MNIQWLAVSIYTCNSTLGDDEQSDFYPESEGATGHERVATDTPAWWDKDESSSIDDVCPSHLFMDPQFRQLLKGSLELMSPTSRSNFKARLKLAVSSFH